MWVTRFLAFFSLTLLCPMVVFSNNTPTYAPSSNSCAKCGFEDAFCKCYKTATCFLNEWGIHLDTLYWKATEDGLVLGNEVLVERSGLDPVTGNYDLVTKGSKEKTPNFDYDTGFRFHISHALPNNNCHIYFEWTHFDTSASTKGHSSLGPDRDKNTYVAFDSNWEALDQTFPDFAKGKWRLDLDLFDLTACRNFCFSRCFKVCPYLGLRCAQINQKFLVHSHADHSGFFNGATYIYSSHLKAQCDYVGVGPLLGCNAEVKLCRCLTLFGQAAGSLVYGRFNCHAREKLDNSDFFYFKFNHFEDHVKDAGERWCSRAMAEFALGLRLESSFTISNWTFPAAIAISWEHHAFYNFNNFNFRKHSFTNTNKLDFDFGPYANLRNTEKEQGNLYTQGLTISTRIGF